MAKYTNESWVATAEKKFPGRFDYSRTNYIDSYHKVLVRCKEHNVEFLADPISFIRTTSHGNVCPECRINEKLTHDEFILAASKQHPLLDFSKSKFVNIRTDVVVVCPDHGEFTKQARRVLWGQYNVCPKCIEEEKQMLSFDLVKKYTENKELGDQPGIFYKIKVTYKPAGISFIKVGFTSLTSFQRYKDTRYDCFDFEIIDEIHTTNLDAAKLEREYKKANKSKRFYLPKDVWFNGRFELYELDGYYQILASQVKFIRDSLLAKQKGKCPICNRDVEMPTLDHYHSRKHYGSGLVRGVLCNTCNRIAGVIENNLARNNIDYSDAPDVLRALGDYIQNKREIYIHPSEKPKSPKLIKSSYNKLVKAVAGKQKVPKYTKKLTKELEKLYEKYDVEPVFHEV